MGYGSAISDEAISLPLLKVVVLSRNRPEYLVETLSSVIESAKLLLKDVRVEIEVSDNSDNDLCIEIVRKYFPRLKIVSRRPNLTVISHFKCVMLEATTDYLVMFHDDDVMKPRFLQVLYSLISQDTEAAAVGCNASYMYNGVDLDKTFMKPGQKILVIDTKEKLLEGYFLIGSQNTSPFPGYIYRIKKLAGILFDETKGGIHADVSFLIDVIDFGTIKLTPEILMSYRIHEGNVNKQSTVAIKFNLLRHLNCHVPMKNSQALQDFHYTILIGWFREQHLSIIRYYKWSHRQKVIFRFVLLELIRHLFLRPECRSMHLRVLYEKASLLVSLRLARI